MLRKDVLELGDPSGSHASRRGTYRYTARGAGVRLAAVKEPWSSGRALVGGPWRAA